LLKEAEAAMTDAHVGRAERDAIPTRAGLDRTAGLLLEGYPFLAERRRGWGSGPHADATQSSCACSGSGQRASAARRR
jgi:hypothetical protein